MRKRNFFVVIEGIDFTGKATQAKLLVRRLRRARIPVAYFDFPQYARRSASFIKDYLAGEFGDAAKLDPKIATVFYAMDRFSVRDRLRNALRRGVVVSNRYTTSNFGHQASRYPHLQDRVTFWKWVQHFEYESLGLPRPDVVFILTLPLAVSVALGRKRKDQKYVSSSGKTTDQLQKNVAHLARARESYLALARMHPRLCRVIDCFDPAGNTILPPRAIAEKIWNALGCGTKKQA